MTYLLDTSALLVLYRREPGFERVLGLFEDDEHELLLCALSVAEFGRKLSDLGLEPEKLGPTLDLFVQLFSRVVPVDEAVARASLQLAERVTERLPTVDSLIAAAALVQRAALVHRDRHLATIPPEVLATLRLQPD